MLQKTLASITNTNNLKKSGDGYTICDNLVSSYVLFLYFFKIFELFRNKKTCLIGINVFFLSTKYIFCLSLVQLFYFVFNLNLFSSLNPLAQWHACHLSGYRIGFNENSFPMGNVK